MSDGHPSVGIILTSPDTQQDIKSLKSLFLISLLLGSVAFPPAVSLKDSLMELDLKRHINGPVGSDFNLIQLEKPLLSFRLCKKPSTHKKSIPDQAQLFVKISYLL
jgi:hypothetical protein